MQYLHTPLAEIARTAPASTRVFLRHKLDFCCGGRRTLADACERAGLDPDEIESELANEVGRAANATRWDRENLAQLADHIETHFHAALRRDMPSLIEAARKVERVHAGKPEVPTGLAQLLADFWEEMQHHMAKEEQALFPMIRRGLQGERLYMPVSMMEAEHEEHGERLAAIRALTHDMTPPAHACATWRALYDGLAHVDEELREHIHLENNVLFPSAVAR